MILEKIRVEYHKGIFEHLLSVDDNGVPNNADKYSQISVELAKGIVEGIAMETAGVKTSGQTSGNKFEKMTATFIEKSFQEISHLRGGQFEFFIGKSIEAFEQYEHLATLSETLKNNRELRTILGDYLVHPDIVIGRLPVSDEEINFQKQLISESAHANLTPLRMTNS